MWSPLPASYRPVAVLLFLLLALSANDLVPLAATETPEAWSLVERAEGSWFGDALGDANTKA